MDVLVNKVRNNELVKTGVSAQFEKILTRKAIQFVGDLHRKFNTQRIELLENRIEKNNLIKEGRLPDFLLETKDIREGDWTVSDVPEILKNRKVEIFSSVEKVSMENALNSDASIYVADFEDNLSPTWNNIVQGQINLNNVIQGNDISERGQSIRLKPYNGQIFIRPRGWHLTDKYILVDGDPISASLLDFGLFIYHNIRDLTNAGKSPCLYLPKIESYLEARLWNDVFIEVQKKLSIEEGSIKATVIIETIGAAFQMDEILYELKDHSCGLSLGLYDYIFSCVKTLSSVPVFTLANQDIIAKEDESFFNSLSQLLIKTCHKRNTHAIGGLPFLTTDRENFASNVAQEAKLGFDGTSTTNPNFVNDAKKVFDELIKNDHQIENKLENIAISVQDFLKIQKSEITRDEFTDHIETIIIYLETWINGKGNITLKNSVQNTATVEVLRTQIWHLLQNNDATLSDGVPINYELFESCMSQVKKKLENELGVNFEKGRFCDAFQIFDQISTDNQLEDYLTDLPYLIL